MKLVWFKNWVQWLAHPISVFVNSDTIKHNTGLINFVWTLYFDQQIIIIMQNIFKSINCNPRLIVNKIYSAWVIYIYHLSLSPCKILRFSRWHLNILERHYSHRKCFKLDCWFRGSTIMVNVYENDNQNYNLLLWDEYSLSLKWFRPHHLYKTCALDSLRITS